MHRSARLGTGGLAFPAALAMLATAAMAFDARSARAFALAFAVAAPLGAAACGEGPVASIAARPSLSRRDWLAHTRSSLRRETCEPGARFRRCSDLDRDGCEQQMNAALAICTEGVAAELPEVIDAGVDDVRGRDQLTGCMWHHAAMELGPSRVDMLCLLSSR